MSIAVVGNVFVDIKGFPYDKYIPDGRNAGWIETVHGGVGRNVAEDIANIGIDVSYVGMVDDNAQGDDVEKRLRERGVDTRYTVKTPDGMGIWLAVFNNDGDIAGSISKRPNTEPLVALIKEKGDEIFSSCDCAVIEMDCDHEAVELSIDFAHKHGKPVIGVVANIQKTAERRDLISRVDCFICNKLEAGILFMKDYADLNPEEMSEELLRGIKNCEMRSMIVTMGGLGAAYAVNSGSRGICEAKNVAVVDTTGAGDAYCAGVAAAITHGMTFPEALRVGSEIASRVITISESVCSVMEPASLGINRDYINTSRAFENGVQP